MMSKQTIIIIITILMFFVAKSELLAISAYVNITSEIKSGRGTYQTPYVINDLETNYKIDISGTGKENARYWVMVHLDHYRSCNTVDEYKDLTYSQVQDRIFNYKAQMTGWYYIRCDINDGSGYTVNRNYMHIYFCVPPLNPFTMPYNIPSGNVPPTPRAELLNVKQGSGSYTNPFIITDPVVKFRIDGSTDANGEDDLRKGVYIWAIHMQGGYHPKYCKIENELIAAKTYLYYNEVKGAIFEWDTRERPSADGYYMLVVPIIDQHGAPSVDREYFFKYEGGSDTEPYLSISPGELDFGSAYESIQITVKNAGSGVLNWNATESPDQHWITAITPASGSLNSSSSAKITVNVNRLNLAEGKHSGLIKINSNGGSEDVSVTISVGNAPQPPQNVQVMVP
ncbi:BACON domain-containing protein [candidate division KSB1 bacterium]|nr:BACON domain-containing protein [candidate division KSB1 bacterium]